MSGHAREIWLPELGNTCVHHGNSSANPHQVIILVGFFFLVHGELFYALYSSKRGADHGCMHSSFTQVLPLVIEPQNWVHSGWWLGNPKTVVGGLCEAPYDSLAN